MRISHDTKSVSGTPTRPKQKKTRPAGRHPPPWQLDVKQVSKLGGLRSDAFNRVQLSESCWVVSAISGSRRMSLSGVAQAAVAALNAFHPADEIEGMLAAQEVALHAGAMECLRRSMHPDNPSDVASRLRRDGANSARAMTEMLANETASGASVPRWSVWSAWWFRTAGKRSLAMCPPG